jgi:hypothetical protein
MVEAVAEAEIKHRDHLDGLDPHLLHASDVEGTARAIHEPLELGCGSQTTGRRAIS